MVKKQNKREPLSEKEKEQLKLVIPFDVGKAFITNLNVLLQTDENFQKWKIGGWNFKSNSKLAINFELKSSAVDQIIEDIDVGQKRITDTFIDPDLEEL